MHQTFLAVCLVFVHSTAWAGMAQLWSTLSTPAPGLPRVIGSYTAGCIQGALPLPSEGVGFQTMRRQRQRFFGHPTLVHAIQELGHTAASQGWGILSIGDLGQARGGPTPYGHRSHQNGLDADIWFWLTPHPLPPQGRETTDAPSMLTADRRALHPERWQPYHAPLLRTAAELPQVERLFVHPLVKRALCTYAPGAAWLRKFRPWWGHDDHFHLRLRCPEGEEHCLRQEPLPEGTGCGAALEWWFTEEAQTPPKRAPSEEVPLPAACAALLKP